MDYKKLQMNYNKIIYLEILDNTINEYKKEVLVPKSNEMIKDGTYETYKYYYENYNKYVFKLIKEYNYYYNLFSNNKDN